MRTKKELQAALKKFIDQTDQALQEGWIYSEDYQDVLRAARSSISDTKEEDFTYPDLSGFHVVRNSK